MKVLVAVLVLVGIFGGGAVADAAGGCPPGWDDKSGLDVEQDRNGDGVVCVDRSQTANPNLEAEPFIDNNYGGPEPQANPPGTTGGPPYDPGCDPGPSCPPD